MANQTSRFATWPMSVSSLSDVPRALRDLADEALAGEPAGQMLLVPLDLQPGRLWRAPSITPSHLLVRVPGRLLVVRGDENGEPARAWTIPLGALLAVEWGQILLHSWVRFVFAASSAVGEVRIQYNTVGARYMWPLLVGLMADVTEGDPRGQGPEGLELAAALPLKFRNALRSELFPWERLLTVSFQPFLAERWFRRRRRVRFPGTLLAGTTHHVVLMEEDSPSSPDYARWGVTATYFPLSRVRAVSTQPSTTNGGDVTVRVEAGRDGVSWFAERKFGADLLPALQASVDQINRLRVRQETPA